MQSQDFINSSNQNIRTIQSFIEKCNEVNMRLRENLPSLVEQIKKLIEHLEGIELSELRELHKLDPEKKQTLRNIINETHEKLSAEAPRDSEQKLKVNDNFSVSGITKDFKQAFDILKQVVQSEQDSVAYRTKRVERTELTKLKIKVDKPNPDIDGMLGMSLKTPYIDFREIDSVDKLQDVLSQVYNEYDVSDKLAPFVLKITAGENILGLEREAYEDNFKQSIQRIQLLYAKLEMTIEDMIELKFCNYYLQKMIYILAHSLDLTSNNNIDDKWRIEQITELINTLIALNWKDHKHNRNILITLIDCRYSVELIEILQKRENELSKQGKSLFSIRHDTGYSIIDDACLSDKNKIDTPLTAAIKQCSIAWVKFLLDKDASLESRTISEDQKKFEINPGQCLSETLRKCIDQLNQEKEKLKRTQATWLLLYRHKNQENLTKKEEKKIKKLILNTDSNIEKRHKIIQEEGDTIQKLNRQINALQEIQKYINTVRSRSSIQKRIEPEITPYKREFSVEDVISSPLIEQEKTIYQALLARFNASRAEQCPARIALKRSTSYAKPSQHRQQLEKSLKKLKALPAEPNATSEISSSITELQDMLENKSTISSEETVLHYQTLHRKCQREIIGNNDEEQEEVNSFPVVVKYDDNKPYSNNDILMSDDSKTDETTISAKEDKSDKSENIGSIVTGSVVEEVVDNINKTQIK